MHENYNSLIEYKNVLAKASEIIGGRVAKSRVDDEEKLDDERDFGNESLN